MRTRVLVLDDQEYLREIMAAVLNDAGYRARPVATVDEAWRRLEELRPEVLVLDLSLPNMSGIEFLQRLRAEPAWKTLPVVIVSGDPLKLSEIESQPYVVTLHKPFDVTALTAVVTRLLAPAPPLTAIP
jgi:two-component system, OmpR family, response regulator VicR